MRIVVGIEKAKTPMGLDGLISTGKGDVVVDDLGRVVEFMEVRCVSHVRTFGPTYGHA